MKKTTAIYVAAILLISTFSFIPLEIDSSTVQATFLPADYETQASDWWNSEWSYCKRIVINHSYVDANLTNFPILVSNTSAHFANAQSDGDDFVFVNETNATQYNHEIENFSSTTNTLIAWVNVTDLRGDVDTVLYLYYGNATCPSQENITNTWDQYYVAVWHMNNNATGNISDSTINFNNGTQQENAHQATGFIGYAQVFDNTTYDNINVVHDSSLECIDVTISVWWNTISVPGDFRQTIVARNYISGDYMLVEQFSGNEQRFYWHGNGTNGIEGQNIVPAQNVWYYTGVTRDNSTQKVYWYINGSEGMETDPYDVWVDKGIAYNLTIGVAENAILPHTWPFNGTIDELRISNINRSKGWMCTEYNTSFYPSSFLTLGAEVQAGSAPTLSNPVPTDGSSCAASPTNLSITVNDAEGLMMNMTWWSNSSGTWTFFASNDSFYNGTYRQQNTNFTCGGTFYWSANVSDTDDGWTNETYSLTTQTHPWAHTPNPANVSTGNSINTDWTVTIEDNCTSFGWSIQCDSGNSSSDSGDSNGSKGCEMYLLSYSTQYKVWVNISNGNCSDTMVYLFTTQASDNPVLSTPQPTNSSTGIIMYPWLNITVNHNLSKNFNITWLHNNSGAWTEFAWNDTLTNGTYRQRATWVNSSATEYWWAARANDSDGVWMNKTFYFTTATYTWSNWSAWWYFTYSADHPYDFVASAYDSSIINLSWQSNVSADTDILIVNESGWTSYPINTTNGTLIYNGTNLFYNHTGLSAATTYYYSIWGYNATENENSTNYSTAFNTTDSRPTIWAVYPVNGSTSIPLQPSCQVVVNNSDGGDFDIYFLNSTDNSHFYYKQTNSSVAANATTYWWYVDAGLYSTTYYWKVNVSDGLINTSEIFSFTTQANILPNQTGVFPLNNSVNVSLSSPLNVTIYDGNGDNMNATWYSNSSGTWVIFGDNLDITSGATHTNITQTNINFSDFNVTYYWSLNISDDTGWTNDTYGYTTQNLSPPTNFQASAINSTRIVLTWTENNGADSTVIIRNATDWSPYPTPPWGNGTIVYNGTDEFFNDSGLGYSTRYNYSAWSYNLSSNNFSNYSDYTTATTLSSDLELHIPFPANSSTSVSRPPTNISINLTGTNIYIYIYYYNMTPETSIWTLLSNWTGDSGRYESKTLSTVNGTTQFIWGNTTYNWSVNATDGTMWLNNSYSYTTNATISGKNARMDVDNDGSNINVVDLSTDWGQRTVGAYKPYNGLYDVDNDDIVNVVDLSYIWGQRTV